MGSITYLRFLFTFTALLLMLLLLAAGGGESSSCIGTAMAGPSGCPWLAAAAASLAFFSCL